MLPSIDYKTDDHCKDRHQDQDIITNVNYEFNIVDFCSLNDDLPILFYLMNYRKSEPINEHEINRIFSKVFETDTTHEVILATLLTFISENSYNDEIDFSIIYNNFLKSLDYSPLLINVMIQFMAISKQSEIYTLFLMDLLNDSECIYQNCFWTFC